MGTDIRIYGDNVAIVGINVFVGGNNNYFTHGGGYGLRVDASGNILSAHHILRYPKLKLLDKKKNHDKIP